MAKLFILCLLTVFLSGCGSSTSGSAEVDELMNQLDAVIQNRESYLAEKESKLALLHEKLSAASTDIDKYNALGELFTEYHPFNTDSAYAISRRQTALARQIGDSALVMRARLNMANTLSATGMFSEALECIRPVTMADIPRDLYPFYFHTKRTLFGRLADYAAFESERQHYRRLTLDYRDSILDVNEPNTLPHVITLADKANALGRPGEAIELLTRFCNDNDLSAHERAICSWTMSESYAATGDTENRKKHLIIASIGDLKASVREYISLHALAFELYLEGDLDRAYNLMSIAIDDAEKCNARQRIIEMNSTYPMINKIYVDTVRDQKNSLVKTIGVITVMSLVLLVMLFIMRKQMKRIGRARHEIEDAYKNLNSLNEKLSASNKKLAEANQAIAENSELKEVYIGRYMDQCLAYIEKLDSYRRSIAKILNTGNSELLKKTVKSTNLIDEELKNFYGRFDETFLSLFPTFVEDFNALLLPEEAIVPKKPGSLNTELRIFALIRLGISDSDKIAKFLRYSLNTIYNYRTKVRNKARGDRNMLETEILKIGRTENSPANESGQR